MKKMRFFVIILIIQLLAGLSAGQNLTVREMMRERSVAGMRPESEKLSPDGQLVIFSWNAEGYEPRNLYLWSNGQTRLLVNAQENFELRSQPPESKLNYGLIVRDEFSKAREKNLAGVEFSPNSQRILFLQNSDIYVLDLQSATAKPRRITRTQGPEGAARWLTNDAILYSSGGNFFVLNLAETSLVQITREANPSAFVSVFGLVASKDGRFAAYTLSDGSRQRALFVPDYLGEYTTAPTTRRGWTDQRVFVTPTDGRAERPFEIKLPKPEGASYIRSLKWASDNKSLLIDRVDKDTKRRQLYFVSSAGGKAEMIILITEETDEKWIAPLSRIVEPAPLDPTRVLFASERDGFNHLYLATIEKSGSEPGELSGKVETTQITKGNYEVNFAAWNNSPDDANEVIFASTEKTTTGRQFFAVNVKSGRKWQLPSNENGMKTDSQLAGSNGVTNLLFKGSRWNEPTELFLHNVCTRCQGLRYERKITESRPEAFMKMNWSEPKFIDIPTRDGKVVKSKVYVPANFDKNQKYPMVMFIHGAGYLQNTINGWNNYYREFMFNQMLTQKGYVVFDIDFRGSAGYGRDWRTDVHDFLGGKDFEDHLDAIDYAVANYAVDPKRVGVYGGSYGGFMAGMLIMRAPEKVAAAAALRSVFDWKNYYAASNVYTTERLGFPDKNPEAYKRSSPIAYADQLKKPLLILHGLADDNVHAQDSIQLIEKLMRLEKTEHFEAMIYPSENHGFVRPSSWADEYERIFRFFEKHLRN